MPSNSQRNFFLTQQLVPAIINGMINGGIAWGMHHSANSIGLWEHGAYAQDLLATGLLLPSITWFIVRPLLRSQATKGKAPDLQDVPTPWLDRWMPGSLWGGALRIGLIGMVLVGGAGVLAMTLAGAPDFSGPVYAVVKGIYAGLLTMALQPVMVFAALRPVARAQSGA
jgi:hypothetical protein